MRFEFRKAERRRARARIGLCGPAGAGKTHSALLVASGLAPGGRVVVLDTENASAELEEDERGGDQAARRRALGQSHQCDRQRGAA